MIETILFVLLLIALILLFCCSGVINYQKHCIEDTESILKLRTDDFVSILRKLNEYQNFEPAGRDTCTRRLINETIVKYSNENKKELSTSDQTVR